MKQFIHLLITRRKHASALALLLGLLSSFIFGIGLPARPAYAAGSVTVSTPNDVVDGNTTSLAALSASPGADGQISLREALLAANNTASTAGSPNTINLPANTYNLNPSSVVGTGELQLGNATNQRTDIVGAGAATTTIHQSNAGYRVFELDPNVVGNVAVNLSGVTLSGGFAQAFGGGAILGGGTNDSLGLTNVVITANHCAGPNSGAGINWSPAGNITISNSTFSNNTCASGGGGALLYTASGTLTINNSTFSGNTAAATGSAGGALLLGGSGTFNINGSTFTTNQATNASGIGGAIYLGGGTLNLGTTAANRFVGNTAGVSTSSGLGVRGGTANATNNWWGCNGGPGTGSGCDKADNSGGTLTFTPWVVLMLTASPNPINLGQSTTLTASFLQNSVGTPLTAAQVSALNGVPVTWSNAVNGSLTNQQATIQPNGTATATFTPTACGTGSADAKVDNATVTAGVTIRCPDLTTTKTHAGNFSQGQTGAQYTISVANSGVGPTSGTVSVVDTLPAGLTATALSGPGWTCTLGTLTCTRSDTLATSSSFPNLVLTVNVAGNAPGNVTNSATVSGGGEQNTNNNTATDPTTINVPTATPTNTPTPTTTDTPTNTPTNTTAPTATDTPTNTPTNTPAPTATDTPTNTPTNTLVPTATDTPTNTPTNTPAPTATDTPTNTPTNTLVPTATDTPTNTPTNTSVPTATDTPTNTPTNTLAPTATGTPTNTPTNTLVPTATATPTNTPTNTPAPPTTNTPTNTPTPTKTPSKVTRQIEQESFKTTSSTNVPDATYPAQSPKGVVVLTLKLENKGNALRNVSFRVTKLTNNNYLLNADGGPGQVGSKLSVPNSALPGGNQLWDKGEHLTQNFRIGLLSRSGFTFQVDVYASKTTVAAAMNPTSTTETEELVDSFLVEVNPEAPVTSDNTIYLPVVSK